MRLMILVLAATAAYAQSVFPPASGGGGGPTTTPYTASVTAQTTLTVTAATHGQGALPIASCWDNSTPRVAVSCAYTRAANGDVVFSWSPAFTGQIQIGVAGGKGDTGAAGINVTVTSEAAGANCTYGGQKLVSASGTAYVCNGGPTIASGTASLGTSAITANSCATVVTVAATGVATTDVIEAGFNADVSGTTGYGAGASDGLVVYRYPAANNVNFKVCNTTGSSITPGAATLNWRVAR